MAIKFEKIQPGMTLWDVRPNTGRTQWKWATWPVYVREVDAENRKVFASWNGNRYEWMSERRVCRYRAKSPEQKNKW